MRFHLVIVGAAAAVIIAIVFGLYCLWAHANSALVGKIALTLLASLASVGLSLIAAEHGRRIVSVKRSRRLGHQSTINNQQGS